MSQATPLSVPSSLDGETLVHLSRKPEDAEPEQLRALVAELRALRDLQSEQRSKQTALMSLTRSEAIGRGDLEPALREITKTAAEILGCARASVWRYAEDRQSLVCLSLWREDEQVHEEGIELAGADFPDYFEALRAERIIAAHDAHTDPRTAEFSDVYLTPLDIHALLDAPIRVGGRVIGVLCNEHTGRPRTWTGSDEQIAAALADFTALAIESHERQQTEDELRKLVEVAEQRLETIERQRIAIADLSAPIIDVWDEILALPIVGLVDSQRSIELTERLLERIASTQARAVIVDLTGVDVVDTMTANHLLQMIRAARLLGTYCVLSGISPQIAQTLVQLEVELDEIATVRNLKEGLRACLRLRHERATVQQASRATH